MGCRNCSCSPCQCSSLGPARQTEAKGIRDLSTETVLTLDHYLIVQAPDSPSAKKISIRDLRALIGEFAFGAPNLPTLNPSQDGTTLTGTADPGVIITAESGGYPLVNSIGLPVSATVAADGAWTLAGIAPPLTNGQTITILATNASDVTRTATFVLVVTGANGSAPTGSVSLILPNGTIGSPNTLLDVNTAGITAPNNATIAFTYRWGQKTQTDFLPFSTQLVPTASNKQFNPVTAGVALIQGSAINISCEVTAAVGNASATFRPQNSAAPQTSAGVVYDYNLNPFF